MTVEWVENTTERSKYTAIEDFGYGTAALYTPVCGMTRDGIDFRRLNPNLPFRLEHIDNSRAVIFERGLNPETHGQHPLSSEMDSALVEFFLSMPPSWSNFACEIYDPHTKEPVANLISIMQHPDGLLTSYNRTLTLIVTPFQKPKEVNTPTQATTLHGDFRKDTQVITYYLIPDPEHTGKCKLAYKIKGTPTRWDSLGNPIHNLVDHERYDLFGSYGTFLPEDEKLARNLPKNILDSEETVPTNTLNSRCMAAAAWLGSWDTIASPDYHRVQHYYESLFPGNLGLAKFMELVQREQYERLLMQPPPIISQRFPINIQLKWYSDPQTKDKLISVFRSVNYRNAAQILMLSQILAGAKEKYDIFNRLEIAERGIREALMLQRYKIQTHFFEEIFLRQLAVLGTSPGLMELIGLWGAVTALEDEGHPLHEEAKQYVKPKRPKEPRSHFQLPCMHERGLRVKAEYGEQMGRDQAARTLLYPLFDLVLRDIMDWKEFTRLFSQYLDSLGQDPVLASQIASGLTQQALDQVMTRALGNNTIQAPALSALQTERDEREDLQLDPNLPASESNTALNETGTDHEFSDQEGEEIAETTDQLLDRLYSEFIHSLHDRELFRPNQFYKETNVRDQIIHGKAAFCMTIQDYLQERRQSSLNPIDFQRLESLLQRHLLFIIVPEELLYKPSNDSNEEEIIKSLLDSGALTTKEWATHYRYSWKTKHVTESLKN